MRAIEIPSTLKQQTGRVVRIRCKAKIRISDRGLPARPWWAVLKTVQYLTAQARGQLKIVAKKRLP